MPFLRLRNAPGGDEIIAYIENGARITVLETALDKIGREWHHVTFTGVVPHLFKDEAMTQPYASQVSGYAYAAWIQFPPAHPAPVFTVDKTVISAGESVTLAWNAPGASALHLNTKGVTGPAGTLVSTPDKTMTYSFVASYAGEPVVVISATVTVNPAPVTPPVPALRSYIGLHTLWDDDPGVDKAIKAGCRIFTSMSYDQCARCADKLGKTAAIDGKGIVLRRFYIDGAQWPWDADHFISDVLSWGDKRLIYLGPNECEGLHDDKVKAILDHAKFDVYVSEKLAARGYQYGAGSYAVGNPDMTKVEEVKALHDGYADWWNGFYAKWGMYPIWDYHSYSPDENHMTLPGISVNTLHDWQGRATQVPMHEHDWHETRPMLNFALAGWRVDAGYIVSSETGIDKGGKGGFRAVGQSAPDIIKWGHAYRAAWALPVTDFAGTVAPMRFLGGTIFQSSDPSYEGKRWGSYYVGDQVEAIGTIY